jgi:hypothetical protein
MKCGEFLYSLGGGDCGGLLGSQEGLCCMQLVLARGVPPVTARLVVVTLNGRVIGWLLHGSKLSHEILKILTSVR